MSLLRRIFSGATVEEDLEAAEKLLAEGDPGSAKLRFERAFSKATKAEDQLQASITARISFCCDEIARTRLREAKDLLESGQLDLAESELHGALEVARDEKLRGELGALLEQIDHTRLLGAGIANEPPPEPTSLYAAMRSAEPTEEDQSLEYDSYGAPFQRALQATFENDAPRAVEEFETLLAEAKDPRYLHYELALAYRLAERNDEAQEHFRTFLSRIASDEGGVARIQAHVALASNSLEQHDHDAAIEEMQRAVEALPQSPSAYYELGSILRRCGHPNEAADVLRAALELDGGDHWMMRQGLGLALIDAGESTAAQAELEQVVNIFVEREDLRLPVETAESLAKLYETSASYTKAADLYRMLCEAASGEQSATFHLRAGALLAKADKRDAAATMLKRAQALADEYGLIEISREAAEERAALASD